MLQAGNIDILVEWLGQEVFLPEETVVSERDPAVQQLNLLFELLY